jgi:hypothetical protein
MITVCRMHWLILIITYIVIPNIGSYFTNYVLETELSGYVNSINTTLNNSTLNGDTVNRVNENCNLVPTICEPHTINKTRGQRSYTTR